jgi:hypothetical protein
MKHHPALKRAIVCTVTHIHDTMSAERRLNRILGHLDASQCRSTQNPVAAESSLRIAAPSTPKPVSLDAWKANVGKEIGVSSWLHLTQERVDAFGMLVQCGVYASNMCVYPHCNCLFSVGNR